MVLAMLAGLPLLALAVRWLAGPGTTWLQQRHGLDVTPWLPMVWTFVVVIHVPTMLGATSGLLFCEDRDTHVLPAVALTRASLRTLVAVRITTTVAVAVAAVAIGLPLAGAGHALGAAGLAATAIVGGTVAVVPMLALATLARDRVQGVALLKAITLPLYLPLAAFVVDGPWDVAALAIPTGWAVAVARAQTPVVLAGAAVLGTAACAAIAGLLARRLVRTAAT
jgi:hypothetical protein